MLTLGIYRVLSELSCFQTYGNLSVLQSALSDTDTPHSFLFVSICLIYLFLTFSFYLSDGAVLNIVDRFWVFQSDSLCLLIGDSIHILLVNVSKLTFATENTETSVV